MQLPPAHQLALHSRTLNWPADDQDAVMGGDWHMPKLRKHLANEGVSQPWLQGGGGRLGWEGV